MRVTEGMRLAHARRALQQSASNVHEIAQQASSGKRVAAPSDDPRAYASVLRRSHRIAQLESRRDELDHASRDVGIAESALASGSDMLVRAREIAVQMADGSNSPADRAVAAQEIASLREALLAVANTQGPSGYVFAGTASDTEPFDAAGAYGGNGASVLVEHADGMTMATNLDGQTVFAAGQDVFADLTALEQALQNDDGAGIQAAIDTVDAGHRQLVDARAELGLRLDRMTSARDIADGAATLATKHLSEERDIDAAATFTELSTAQNAYERSLALTQRLLELANTATQI